MKRKMRDWQTWLLTLWAGVVGGFASSGTVWISMLGVEKMGVTDMPQINMKAFFVMAAVGAVSHAFMYLKQSPIPPEIEYDDGVPPPGSLVSVIIATTIAASSILFFAGCASITSTESLPIKLKSVAYIGTWEALRAHPEWKPSFESATHDLKIIETSETLDLVTVVAILQSLPIKELRGERTVVYITAATLLLDDATLRVKIPAQAQAIARALREGIELGTQ